MGIGKHGMCYMGLCIVVRHQELCAFIIRVSIISFVILILNVQIAAFPHLLNLQSAILK